MSLLRWNASRLGKEVEILDSRRVPVNAKERATRVGSVPYFGATGQVGWIDEALFDEELVLLGEDGAPFFDRTRDVAYRIDGPAWVNNHAHVLRAGGRLTNRFLLHQLNQVDFRPFVSGTTRPKLPQGPMREIPLVIPPLAEQHRIVAAIETHFSRLDAAVASLTRARANVKRARASVLKAAVEARLVPTEAALARAEGRDYEPASTLLARILAERKAAWSTTGARGKYKEPRVPDTRALSNSPEGWCLTNIDSLLAEPLRNGKSAKASGNAAGIRTLTLTAVTTGRFSEENTKLTVATADDVEGLWLEPGDLLVQRSNTPELVGTTALYNGERHWAVYPDLLIRIRATKRVDVRWLSSVLRGPALRRHFRKNAKGIAGTMPKIGQETIEAAVVPLPPLAEQRRIVAEVDRRLSVLDALDATLEASLGRCARLRQAVLKRAFEGRLVPMESPATTAPPPPAAEEAPA